jgi:hypothetical protein
MIFLAIPRSNKYLDQYTLAFMVLLHFSFSNGTPGTMMMSYCFFSAPLNNFLDAFEEKEHEYSMMKDEKKPDHDKINPDFI